MNYDLFLLNDVNDFVLQVTDLFFTLDDGMLEVSDMTITFANNTIEVGNLPVAIC
ncbi:hypothetical protein D3C72_2554920 [compost metagenome]